MAPEPFLLILEELLNQAGLSGVPYSVRVRYAEIDPANLHGIAISRIILSDLKSILVFYVPDPDIPEDKIKKEMEKYLESSGAFSGILIFGSEFFEVIRGEDLVPVWYSGINGKINECKNSRIPFKTGFVQNLVDYLKKIYNTALRIYFREYGEGNSKLMRLHILSVMIEILLQNMSLRYDINLLNLSDQSLFNQLKTLAYEIPGHYEILASPPEIDRSIRFDMVEAGVQIPIPDGVKISWIDPILLTKLIIQILEERDYKKKQKNQEFQTESREEFLISSSVFRIILDEISLGYQIMPVIIDPACNTGESLLLLFRKYAEERDSVGLRLERVSSRIYGTDSSFESVMLTRFGLVLSIIDSSFNDRSLLDPGPTNLISDIREHITVGSCIIPEGAVNDYISEQDRRYALRILPPLSKTWARDIPTDNSIILTVPQNLKCEKEPAIKNHLCMTFSSYSDGMDYSLLVAEYVLMHYDLPSYLFLNMNWFSEAKASRFRRYLKISRINQIIYPEPGTESIGDLELSAIISSDKSLKNSDQISIITVDDTGLLQIYYQIRNDLSETDGWNLKDPARSQLLDLIKRNSVTLYDYCLGEMYSPEVIIGNSEDEIWISLIPDRNNLKVVSSPHPDHRSIAVIKGPDPFLEGLMISSLFKWLYRDLIRKWEVNNVFRLLSDLPVFQPDWYDPFDCSIVEIITTGIRKRTYLLNLLALCRYHHDQKRVKMELVRVNDNINDAVLSLYRIPHSLRYIFKLELHSEER
jgi:hypothetical protein